VLVLKVSLTRIRKVRGKEGNSRFDVDAAKLNHPTNPTDKVLIE
jgi:hypothetical protein